MDISTSVLETDGIRRVVELFWSGYLRSNGEEVLRPGTEQGCSRRKEEVNGSMDGGKEMRGWMDCWVEEKEAGKVKSLDGKVVVPRRRMPRIRLKRLVQ